MERFNYPNIAAVRAESAELYYLLECEQYGERKDEEERQEEMQREQEEQQRRIEMSQNYG
jgi:hypothetical protein